MVIQALTCQFPYFGSLLLVNQKHLPAVTERGLTGSKRPRKSLLPQTGGIKYDYVTPLDANNIKLQ